MATSVSTVVSGSSRAGILSLLASRISKGSDAAVTVADCANYLLRICVGLMSFLSCKKGYESLHKR